MSDETYTTRPTSQIDLEARVERDHQTLSTTEKNVDPNAVDAPFAVEGNDTSAYIGVDRDRMTYANETERPLTGDGLEDKVAKSQFEGYAFGKDPEPESQQTLGSGSSDPVLAVTSSGEDITHRLVDREALQTKLKEVDAASAKGESPEPLKSTAEFLSDGEGSRAEGEQEASRAPRKAAAQPKPPAASE